MKFRKIIKALIIFLTSITGILLLIIISLNLPFSHRLITNKINTILGNSNLPIHIRSVKTILPNSIYVLGLDIASPENDTIIYAEEIRAELVLSALLKRKIQLRSISVDNANIELLRKSTDSQLNILTAFASDTSEEIGDPASASKQWEVSVGKVIMSGINFQMNDSVAGIHITQKLGKIDIKTDQMSLLSKEILIKSLEIDGLDGSIIMKMPQEDQISGEQPGWNIGLGNLSLNNINLTYNDLSAEVMMSLYLGKGIVKVNKLDLNNQAIDIDKISVIRAEAVIKNENTPGSGLPEKKDSPFAFPWKINGKDVSLEEISFKLINSSDTIINQDSPGISISGLDMRLSDIVFNNKEAGFKLKKLNFDIDNILSIRNMSGELHSYNGSTGLKMEMETGNSRLEIKCEASAGLLDIIGNPGGTVKADMVISNTQISLDDVSYLINDLKRLPFYKSLGDEPLSIKGEIVLEDSNLIIPGISVFQSGNFDFNLDGRIENCFKPSDAATDLNFELSDISNELLMEILKDYGIDNDFPEVATLSVAGRLSDSLKSPGLALRINSNLGNINLLGSIDFKNQSYIVSSVFDRLMPGKILGIQQLGSFNGSAELSATGFNPDSLSGNFTLLIDSMQYKGYEYTNARVYGNLLPGSYDLNLLFDDPSVKCDLGSVINTTKNSLAIKTEGTLFAQLNELNLFKDTLALEATITADVQLGNSVFNTDFILSGLKLTSAGDDALVNQIHANVSSDTLRTKITGDADFFNLTAHVEKPASELGTILKSFRDYMESFIDTVQVSSESRISYLPEMEIVLNISNNNAIDIAIQDSSLQFTKLDLSLINNKADSKVNYNIKGTGIKYKQVGIGNLNASLVDSAGTMNLNIIGENCSVNSIPLNRLLISSRFANRRSITRFSLVDKQDETMYDFNISSEPDSSYYVFKVPSKQLIMNGVQWEMDSPELLVINRTTGLISPALSMHTGNSVLHLSSGNGTEGNSISCELSNVTIASLVREDILPGKPAGSISGYINYISFGESGKKINTDLSFGDVSWSDVKFNSIALNGDFISQTSDDYKIDMTTRLDTSSIVVKGEKKPGNAWAINADFNEIPINTVQPFVKDYLSEIRGSISGYFNISSKDNIEYYKSELNIQGGRIRINPLNSTYKIPEDKVLFSDKRMVFNNFIILDSLDNELLVDGSIDFSNNKSITTDLEITSSKLQVMNTGEDENSSFYGSIFIDSRLNVKGPISRPILRGRILLSEGTEIFFVQKEDLDITESEKTIRFVSQSAAGEPAKNQLKEVPFVKNNSTIETVVEIDPATRINVNLSERLYNLGLLIQGGGVLNYSMLANNQNNLSGRYEISEGTAHLKMIGWPNKEFRIAQGGYIRWEGNVEDPEINIEALNRVRSSYTNPVDGKDRNVDFNVTLKLSNQLSDLNVLFNINTSDQYLMSIINTLSPEEQMKQAITILLFQKIDLPGISTSTDYITEQVNQLVASQLNQLTKTTIKGVDISFGIDSYVQSTEAGGEETKTSLSYEVKRALLNNRAQIELSGRLNDLNKEPGASDLSLNNFSFEYRLDSAATLFLKVYNEHTYEDVFEGEVVNTGVGFSYRKSYRFFGDIWKREKKTRNTKKKGK